MFTALWAQVLYALPVPLQCNQCKKECFWKGVSEAIYRFYLNKNKLKNVTQGAHR